MRPKIVPRIRPLLTPNTMLPIATGKVIRVIFTGPMGIYPIGVKVMRIINAARIAVMVISTTVGLMVDFLVDIIDTSCCLPDKFRVGETLVYIYGFYKKPKKTIE